MVETKNAKAFYNSEIPGDWEVKRLEDACSHFKSGFGITSEQISDLGEYPVYGGNGLRGYTANFTHEGDYLLIGRQGALCGNIQRVSDKVYISEHAIAVQTNKQNNIDFLAYKLEYKNLNRLSESSAQPGLAVEKLLRLKVELPPLPEQKAIARVLSMADAAIHTTQKLIAQKELRKKWLMQQLLTGRKRLMGFGGEWKECRLGELGEFFKGAGVSKSEIKESGLPAIRYGELYTIHHFLIKEVRTFIDNNSAELSKKIQRGDILFAGSGETIEEIGKCASYIIENIAYAGGDIIVFRPKNADSIFLGYLLNSTPVNSQKSCMGKGHSVVHIYPKDIATLLISIPEVNEQTTIAQVLQAADKEINLLKSKAEKLRELKKGLMQQLLTGKVRLKIK